MVIRTRSFVLHFLASACSHRSGVWSASVLLLLVCGCGGGRDRAAVEGKVLFNGRPLAFGTVMFQPSAGQPARADIRPDGTFTMETPGEGRGAVVGPNRVRITCYEPPAPGANNAMLEPSLGRSLIPERYTSFHTSGLEVVVLAGHNEPFVFELTD